jgi:hypothetical protein
MLMIALIAITPGRSIVAGLLLTIPSLQSVKLGQVLRFPLGIVAFNACEAVRVLISTDRGDAVYNFD